MPFAFCSGEPTIRQPPPEMIAAPPGAAACSKAMARAPAARASRPAATPAPPAPTIATSVSYCLTLAIGEGSLLAEHPSLEHDREKACPALDAGWIPVFRQDHAPALTDGLLQQQRGRD